MKTIPQSIRTPLLVIAGLTLAAATLAFAQQQPHDHIHDTATQGAPETIRSAGPDMRLGVSFPAPLKEHTLANMRDHLLTLSEIQDFLARHEFDRAADVAEKRLGMSSLDLHGAHEVAPYMPKGMQDAGTAMHRSASRFALVAQEASIDRDLSRPLAALNAVTQSCVACHAAYRLK
jgi:dienelactone hydrolase